MGAHGQVVVALEAEHEELVKRNLAEGSAEAQVLLHVVIVALGPGQPVPVERGLKGFRRLGFLGPEARGLRGGLGVEGEAMLGDAEKRALDLHDWPELEAGGEQWGGEQGTGRDATKIAMREIGARGPAQAVGGVRGKREAAVFAAQIEGGEDGGGAGEAVAESPVFIAQIDDKRDAVFRTVLEGSGELGIGAALLRIPAEERGEVDGLAGDVVVLGGDALKGQVAQEEKQGGQL